jgi:effector-binding domain-containing protein
MEHQQETQSSPVEKHTKKGPKSQPVAPTHGSLEISETKAMSIKVTFEGESARKILKCEAELRERLSKPDMGKIIGNEILTWTEKRWSEIVEENTDIEYFFAQIRKCSDKSKSIKLLKALSERLASETPEKTAIQVSNTLAGLATASSENVSEIGQAGLTDIFRA